MILKFDYRIMRNFTFIKLDPVFNFKLYPLENVFENFRTVQWKSKVCTYTDILDKI